MKKTAVRLLTVITLLCAANTSFAADYTASIHYAQPPRILAVGGPHVADTSSFYSFAINPANLGLTGDKFLLPPLNLRLAGPLEQMPVLIKEIIEGGEIVDAALDLVTEAGSLNISTDVLGPLTFGGIKKNFGWGLFNTTYGSANVPSITQANVSAGEELLLLFGYGLPIRLPGVTIALGVNVKGFAQFEGVYSGSPLALADFDINAIPLIASLGFGTDAGLTISLFKIFKISGVWENIFTRGYSMTYDNFDDLSSFSFDDIIELFSGEIGNTTEFEWVFKAGIGIDVPIRKITYGLISSWSIYADCNNIMAFVEDDPFERNKILEVSLGTEMLLLNTIALRAGFNETYLSAGLGIMMGKLHIDVAVFGKELGLEPGSKPQLNAALSFSLYN